MAEKIVLLNAFAIPAGLNNNRQYLPFFREKSYTIALMKEKHSDIPVVLTIAGHDPSGGAGIQADIEAIAANRCHAASVITCITVQDSCDLQSVIPQPIEQIDAQARAALNDYKVEAIKIGLIGDIKIAAWLSDLLAEYHTIPVVLDPVLTSGAGTRLVDQTMESVILQRLLPFTDLITPNSPEAYRLAAGSGNLESCAETLLSNGARYVLITGTHEREEQVVNRLYNPEGLIDEQTWDRLPGSYHGSGCTLSAAIAAFLAQGFSMLDAVKEAQVYTWDTLFNGFSLGRGQNIPDRFFSLSRRDKQ
ncbi:MAG: hydroxymethylpyrimidine/phosphomethylpyrimidine kinase [Candidatus Polarisedimenticolaceae bacterium]|nr:hydroxymethylpyrimidine/phosphomethylpyrimidine kinase [Candidatus Polarisedimenticolaceae bacterium]